MSRRQWNRALGTLVLASAAGSVCAIAWAQDDPRPALTPKVYNGLTVLNGGVDLDDAAVLKRMSPQYSLRIIMSGRGGTYFVADSMSIVRQGQVVAEIPEAGPWVLTNLPPGRYTLQGRFNGVPLSREVTIGAGGTTVNWVMPANFD